MSSHIDVFVSCLKDLFIVGMGKEYGFELGFGTWVLNSTVNKLLYVEVSKHP